MKKKVVKRKKADPGITLEPGPQSTIDFKNLLLDESEGNDPASLLMAANFIKEQRNQPVNTVLEKDNIYITDIDTGPVEKKKKALPYEAMMAGMSTIKMLMDGDNIRNPVVRPGITGNSTAGKGSQAIYEDGGVVKDPKKPLIPKAEKPKNMADKYGSYVKGREAWTKWGDKPLIGGNVRELSIQAAKSHNLDPALFAASALEEGMGQRISKPDFISEAYDKGVKDQSTWYVDGFYSYGLDRFGEQYDNLVKKGYLKEDFKDKFHPYEAFNEKKERIQTAAFKNDADALEAKAAMMAYERDRFTDYAKTKNIELTPEAQNFFSLAAYNGGLGNAQKMLDSWNTAGHLKDNAFLNKKPSNYGGIYDNVMRRMQGANMLRGEANFEDGGSLQGEELQIHKGGNAKPLSNDTLEFTGKSHEQGGIDISYGNKLVEVEGGETAFKDTQGNLQIMGNMIVPGTKKKFKNIFKEIAKEEVKIKKQMDDAGNMIQDKKYSDPQDRLTINAAELMIKGGEIKKSKTAQSKEYLAAIQSAILIKANQLGADPNDVASGKLKAKNGITIAKNGADVPGTIKYTDKKGRKVVITPNKRGNMYTGTIDGKPATWDKNAYEEAKKSYSPDKAWNPVGLESIKNNIQPLDLKPKVEKPAKKTKPANKNLPWNPIGLDSITNKNTSKAKINPTSLDTPKYQPVPSVPKEEESNSPYRIYLQELALKYGVDYNVMKRLVTVESQFNPKAVSPKNKRTGENAHGIMQFTEDTAKQYGIEKILTSDKPEDIRKVMEAGVKHFASLQKRYGGDVKLALAAYNGGPGAVEYVKKELGKKSITGDEWVAFMADRRSKRGTHDKDAWHNQTYEYVTGITGTKDSEFFGTKEKPGVAQKINQDYYSTTQENVPKPSSSNTTPTTSSNEIVNISRTGEITKPIEEQSAKTTTSKEHEGNFNIGVNNRQMGTNVEPFNPSQILPEAVAQLKNNVDPVWMQQFTPEYYQPYQVSFQDQINENNAAFAGMEKTLGDDAASLSILAAQKYGANSKVLGEQFRTNQGIEADTIHKNTSLFNDALMKNLQLADQQFVRQATADSKTKTQDNEILQSVSGKLNQHSLSMKRLATYENMYDYRFVDSNGDGIPDKADYQGTDPHINYDGAIGNTQSNQLHREVKLFDANGLPLRTMKEVKDNPRPKKRNGGSITSLFNELTKKMR